MSRWARSRDANEPDIVKALEAVGASVQRTYGMEGEPDLLVGYLGRNYLIEVKNPATRAAGNKGTLLHVADVAPGGEFEGMDRALRKQQAIWHRKWKGQAPAIVRTEHEAMAVIAAPCTCCDCVADAVLA